MSGMERPGKLYFGELRLGLDRRGRQGTARQVGFVLVQQARSVTVSCVMALWGYVRQAR